MSIAQCKAHIQRIRRIHGSDEQHDSDSFLRGTCDRMLALLSEQLYKEPCHFLFELIQNADDNTYAEGIQPQITLAYRSDGLFLFACNEIGMSEANVTAICSINQSTKTQLKKGESSCIGEKGIGFKSCFKVSNKVWIRSNNFTFMFDKTNSLGMVDPIWADFPAMPDDLRENTMICLKIENQDDRDLIREELTKVLKPSSFMFLRRLLKIRVVGLDDAVQLSDGSFLSHSGITVSHSKQSIENSSLSLITTSITKGPQAHKSDYVVSEYTVSNMPTTERRKGVTDSVIKLAFPIGANWHPIIAKQDVFAFLPVCSSGLAFLIQADFLLVASRQEIEAAQPWNRHLQEQLVHALIEAFQQLNETLLRYHWPAYLPTHEVAFDFCDVVINEFKARVMDTPILESQSGKLEKPRMMMILPGLYKDSEGNPLLTSADDCYLSTKYKFGHVSALVKNTLDGYKFIDLLKNFVLKCSRDFQGKPDAWHDRVCAAIMTVANRVGLDELLVLPIIPLENGTWICARSRSRGTYSRPVRPVVLYLPPQDASIVIPKGVSLQIIASHAAQSDSRRHFFRHVGAKALNCVEIYKSILEQHKNPIRNADVETLISHAQYVFSLPSASRHTQSLRSALWLADTQGHPLRGIELHMDDPRSSTAKASVSRYFPKNLAIPHFIHPQYLSAYQNDKEQQKQWLSWLRESLGVHSIPRLYDELNKNLSKEFQWIVNNLSSREWLACLIENWETYRLDKVPTAADSSIPSLKVQEFIGDLMVECSNGKTARLRDTMLPSLRTIFNSTSGPDFHFVDLQHDEKDQKWSKLSLFGVATTSDLECCIKVLQHFSQTGHQPDTSVITKVYKDILGHCEQNMTAKEKIITAFKEHPLVFVNGIWTYLKMCIWDAPRCLIHVLPLAPHYASVRPLFKTYLSLQDASVEHYVSELSMLDNDINSIDRIKEVLRELSYRVKIQPRSNLSALNGRKLFPVVAIDGKAMLVGPNDRGWCIPDAPHLKESFEGALPLLDFDITDQGRLEPLLRALKVLDKRLSQNLIEQEVVEGENNAVLEQEWTNSFQKKVPYLLCLIDGDKYDAAKAVLGSLAIYAVESVSIQRWVVVDKHKIQGKDAMADFVINKNYEMFASNEDLASNDLDYFKLAEKLDVFCKFQKDKLDIVSRVLSLTNHKKIRDLLSQNNVNFEEHRFEKLSTKLHGDTADIALHTRNFRRQPAATGINVEDNSKNEVSVTADEMACHFSHSRKAQGTRKQSRASDHAATAFGDGARIASQRGPRIKQTRERGTAGRHAQAPVIRDDDDHEDEDDVTPFSTTTVARLLNTSRGSQRAGVSGKPNIKIVSDDNINCIDASQHAFGSAAEHESRPSSSAYRKKYLVSEEFDDAQVVRIGEQGEMAMSAFFKNLLGDSYTDTMWTSHTRTDYTDLVFVGDDSQCADFTIHDISGRLTEWLVERDCDQATAWTGKKGSDAITYHVEVKSTYGSHDEPFHMSQNQMDMATRYRIQGENVPRDVYVVMRVSNLAGKDKGGSAHVQPFVDPIGLFEQRNLTYIAPGGYLIFSK